MAERHVPLPVEQPAHGMRDVGGVQPGGGHLIEQRLEGVEVVPVDEGHLHGRALEVTSHLETAEPGSDDDDLGHRGHGPNLPEGL